MNDGNGGSSRGSILITGCSSGIGHDAATRLGARGWRVFATCRKEADCERMRQSGLESMRLDYDDPDSIASALEEVLERTGGTLDALFNNGAFALTAASEDVPRDALRAIFETNLFGYHDLTCRVIPVMRRQGHGRIVNCSSILGFTPFPYRGPYNATKFALEGLTDTLRIELAGTGIHFSLIEPGPITTRIRENTRPHFEKWIDWENSVNSEFYRNRIMPRLYEENARKDRFELPPSAVTGKLVHALESRKPRPRYYVTTPTYLMGLAKRVLSTRSLDKLLTRR